MAEAASGGPAVEIITDPAVVKREAATALITVRTGQTNGETFHVRINQPKGRAVLVAVHL